MHRRKFISLSCLAGLAYSFPEILLAAGIHRNKNEGYVMTVQGKLALDKMGSVLPHEHIITDFSGAEKVVQPRYGNRIAFNKMLPYLQALKQSGVNVLVECTPAYIGRNVLLLQQLSKASGLQIITNTGYYAAVNYKYLPAHAFTETSQQLAARWLSEWQHGIEATGIKPGFIKLGVGSGPLKPMEKKLIKAAAQTHLQSGLKIATHTGDAMAAREEAKLLISEGVSAAAMIWVHAQNDADGSAHVELAKLGCMISLDGVNPSPEAISKYCGYVAGLKNAGLLHKILLSHDDGFAVNTTGNAITFDAYENGNTSPYTTLFTTLKPALLQQGLTEEDFTAITITNPAHAFKIAICRS